MPKAHFIKKKVGLSKIISAKESFNRMKKTNHIVRNFCKIHLLKDAYSKFTKNYEESIIKRKNSIKMGK